MKISSELSPIFHLKKSFMQFINVYHLKINKLK